MIGDDEQRLAIVMVDGGDVDDIGFVDRRDDLLSLWRPFRANEDLNVRRRNRRSAWKCGDAGGDDGGAALRNFGDSDLLSNELQDDFNPPIRCSSAKESFA